MFIRASLCFLLAVTFASSLVGALSPDVGKRERIGADGIGVAKWEQQRPSTDEDAELFRTYCASCHGTRGRGDGPVAGELRKLPPDLTAFARRNGGIFPTDRVRQIVDGRGPSAHGDRDMPVWGDAFRVRSGLSPEAVEARINAIVRYLEKIQTHDAR
jgi:mono/diheme cytochrome c family protein